MIRSLVEIANREDHQLYLVGGFIRDIFFGKACKDVDFVTARAADLAGSLVKGTFNKAVLIDKKYGTLRLIPADKNANVSGSFNVDLSPLRGSSIQEDLVQRDFTLNSLGVNLSSWYASDALEIIDPLGGLADADGGWLRACGQSSLKDDPLRILRAHRLASRYGLSLEQKTREWAIDSRRGLEQVAVERIRDELFAILSANRSAPVLRSLDEDGILMLILPECEPMKGVRQNGYHHLDVWEHSLASLEALESWLADPQELLGTCSQEAMAVLDQHIAGDRTLRSLVKFGILIHDIGKPACRTVDEKGFTHFYGHEKAGTELAASLCGRLRLSNREIDFISQLVRQHMRPIHLFTSESPSRRALSRLFRLGPELYWPLFFSFASDYMATLGPKSPSGNKRELFQQIHTWLQFYDQQIKPKEASPPLVNGRDLMDHLDISPGPVLGKLLSTLRELQWEGQINSREEALRKAAQLLRE
jgi:tRNA nucleotidyltransferase/poly(A) polymerase